MKKDIIKVDIKKAAIAAKNYAASIAKEGPTYIKNNEYSKEKRKAIEAKVNEVNELIFSKEAKDFLRIESNPIIYILLKAVKICTECEIGNCSQASWIAIVYLQKEYPKIHAEIFNIQNGDHTFLVIGRKKGSDPSDPKTWGNAYICDPWANKAYPANQYETNLKNYYFDKNNLKNCLEDFDPKKHSLLEITKFNAPIQSMNKEGINRLIENYKSKTRKLIKCFEKLEEKLKSVAENIKKEYSPKHLKYEITTQQIKLLNTALENIANHIETASTKENYHTTRKWLRSQLKKDILKLKEASTFSQKSLKILFADNNKATLFQTKPKTEQQMIPETVAQKLQKVYEAHKNKISELANMHLPFN